jgi:hypothetical protein
MAKLHIHPPSIQSAIERLVGLAATYAGERFTVLQDPGGWHVALGNPYLDLDTYCRREDLPRWSSGATLEEAVNNLDREIHLELPGVEDLEEGEI